MDLSIVIVNWNSCEYLKKCLASISSWKEGMAYEIVVIDSGSFDGCGEMLKQDYPYVRFIQCYDNLGFAKSNNEAIKVTKGRDILFLNPDAEIEGDAIETLRLWLNDIPDAGIVGARLLNSDRSIQTSCVQAFPTVFNQALDSEVLRKVFPKSKLWGMRPLFEERGAPLPVDMVSGACLMIKRSVFEDLEGFSTDYFMYSEDVDLCFKANQSGWKTYYVPMAIVVHHGGGSSSQSRVSEFSSVMMFESRLRFFRKTYGVAYSRVYRMVMQLVSALRVGMMLMVWPVYWLRGEQRRFQDMLEKWIARLRWAMGREVWVNKY